MDLADIVPLVRRLISSDNFNAIPNGLICLKGGDLKDEVKKFKDEVLPEFYSHFATSGVYNSTSLQLLAENAFAKTVADSVKYRVDLVNAYTNARAVDGNNAASAVGALKGSIHVGSLGASQTQSSVTGLLQAGLTLYTGLTQSTGSGNTVATNPNLAAMF